MLTAWDERHEYAVRQISAITRPGCPERSRKIKFPDYVTMAQDGGKVVKPYAPAAFTRRKYSWYSLLLERKEYVNEKFQ